MDEKEKMSEVDDRIARWLELVGPGDEKDCRVGMDEQPTWYELRLDEAYSILKDIKKEVTMDETEKMKLAFEAGWESALQYVSFRIGADTTTIHQEQSWEEFYYDFISKTDNDNAGSQSAGRPSRDG